MRQYINLLNESILNEAPKSQYYGMFAELPEDLKAKSKQSVDVAIRVMKREDRIVWLLRYLKLQYLVKAKINSEIEANKKGTEDESDKYLKQYDKLVAKMAKGANESPEVIKANVSRIETMIDAFEHFFSLPISEIESYTFGWQTFETINNDLKELEDEWRENLDRTAEVESDHELIIDFGNGWAWWNLNKYYCSAESSAMGHCGNSPGNSSETILSLRKTIDGDTVSPHLTFILDSDGFLGEMKGRNNEKPIEKYHPFIIELLSDYDEIEGIKGGGYLPENNFSLSDLDKEEYDALVAKKPMLGGLREIFKFKYNGEVTKEFTVTLDKFLTKKNLETSILKELSGEGEDTVFEIERWSNLEDFIRYTVQEDEPVQRLLALLESIEDGDAIEFDVEVDDNYYYDVLERLPDSYRERIFNDIEVIKDKGDRNSIYALIDELKGRDSKYIEYMDDAISAKVPSGYKEKIEELLKDYLEEGYYFESPAEIHFDVDAIIEDRDNTEIYATVYLRDFFNLFEADDSGDWHDEYDGWAYAIKTGSGGYGNYFETDGGDDYINERREEEGLTKRSKELEDEIKRNSYNLLDSVKRTMEKMDLNESALSRLKALSGIV